MQAFINLLASALSSIDGVTCRHATDDADPLVIETAMQYYSDYNANVNVTMHGNATDLLVRLINYFDSHCQMQSLY